MAEGNGNGKQHITWTMFWGAIIFFGGVVLTFYTSLSSKQVANGEEISALKVDNSNLKASIIEIKDSLKDMNNNVTQILIKVGGKPSSLNQNITP